MAHTSEAQPSDATRRPISAAASNTRGRETLEELSVTTRVRSAEEQRQLVNAVRPRGAWATCYTRLKEIPQSSNAKTIPAPLTKVWARVDSTAFKVFQQLFCHAAAFVIPGDHRKCLSETMLNATAATTPRLFSVIGCLVDPSRIGEAIAIKMGLLAEKAAPERRTAKDLIQELDNLGAITLLKYYWACTRPLGTRQPGKANERIRVIGPENQDIEREFKKCLQRLKVTPSRAQIGAILVTSEQKPGSKVRGGDFFKPLKLQYFSSIYAALRSTYHEARGYEDEQQRLVALKTAWEGFKTNHQPLWVSAKQLATELKDATSQLEEENIRASAERRNQDFLTRYLPLVDQSLSFFEGSTHEQKKQICTRLREMQAAFLASPNQRVNPIHVSLQTAANQVLLDLRNEEIRIKGTWNHNDQNLLLTTLSEHTEIFRELHQSILEKAELLDSNQVIFSSDELPPYKLKREISSLRTQLRLHVRTLDKISVKPFTELREALQESDKQLDMALTKRDKSSAKDALCKMFFITRAFYLSNAAENARFALLQPWDRLVARLEKIREDLQEAVGTTDGDLQAEDAAKPGRRTAFDQAGRLERSALGRKLNEELDRLFKDIHEIQTDIISLQLVEVSDNGGMPLIDQRTQIYDKARRLLKSFDALSHVRALRSAEIKRKSVA
jgi:hypothetical protein